MAVIDFFVDRVWAIAAFALGLGMMLDVILFHKQLRATLLLPLVVGVMWLWGDSAQMVQKWQNEAYQPQPAQQVPQQEKSSE
ncbi:hypothetical protein G7009_18040 [Pseudomonas capeferrum]|jgi:hypothetical protein|uniref:hypothetical protein n=1 Tax=Pseudomonas TaxID=286 RepID=UPI0015E41FAF|nr:MULTISPECIES: hypothetical protein [Pseudomonas]MBA1203625.1 hypothetical protein [Pseudomonas capeferrum]